MPKTQDRMMLALAACEGLSDQELAERGTAGYRKMRDRKRMYAATARKIAVGAMQQQKVIQNLQTEVAQLKATIAAMEQMDKPVGDTTEAAKLLAGLKKGGAAC